MLTHTAVGTQAEVREYLTGFAREADADELIVAHQFPGVEGRLRSVELTAEAMAEGPPPPHPSPARGGALEGAAR